MRLKQGIETLMAQKNLDLAASKAMVSELLDADSHPFQKVAFLVLLRSKMETADELAGMVAALQENMLPLPTHKKTLDIVGTGGDGANTVNISTGSAILAASCGVAIVKHGNAAVSSQAGSADVLRALGVNIDLSPEKISAGVDAIGIGFCFAPHFHPLLRELRSLRQQLNVPTTFNIIGPLLNPGRCQHLLLGVYDERLLKVMAQTLQKMGSEHSMVVHGGGIDELSCLGPAHVVEVTPHLIDEFYLDPIQLGLTPCRLQDLRGGTPAFNAALLRDALHGGVDVKTRAFADTLIFNAAVALYLYGLEPSVAEAIGLARDKLRDGSALSLLNQWIEYSHD